MRTGRFPTIAIPLTVAGLLAGCAQSGPFAQRQTKLGSLKTSVAQLEHENEQLQGELAEQKAENRRLEDRLVQEKNTNDELATRLDDAKNLIRSQGGEPESLTGASSSSESAATSNVGRKSRPGHKPPFAQIRGQIDEVPAEDADDSDSPQSSRHRDDLGSRRGPNDHRWLPVARGVGDESSKLH